MLLTNETFLSIHTSTMAKRINTLEAMKHSEGYGWDPLPGYN